MSISEPLRIADIGTDGSDLCVHRYACNAYSKAINRSKKLDNDGIAIASKTWSNKEQIWAPIMPSCIGLVLAGRVIQDLALTIS